MVRRQGNASEVLGPNEIAVISQAYDLPLIEIADGLAVLQGWPPSDVKGRMSLAILAKFRTGISDIHVLKAVAIAAVTDRPPPFEATTDPHLSAGWPS